MTWWLGRWFVQFWPFIAKYLPHHIKIAKLCSNFCQILNKSSKNEKIFLRLCQSGNISLNLVPLFLGISLSHLSSLSLSLYPSTFSSCLSGTNGIKQFWNNTSVVNIRQDFDACFEAQNKFFLNGQPRPLFRLFSVFSNKQYNTITTNQCEKMSIQYTAPDLNPQPRKYESSPITTRLGLLPQGTK